MPLYKMATYGRKDLIGQNKFERKRIAKHLDSLVPDKQSSRINSVGIGYPIKKVLKHGIPTMLKSKGSIVIFYNCKTIASLGAVMI